jgi:hypothetical protein
MQIQWLDRAASGHISEYDIPNTHQVEGARYSGTFGSTRKIDGLMGFIETLMPAKDE